MSSKKPSKPVDWQVPTTPEDVRALRRARQALRPWPLDALNALAPSALFPARRKRLTQDGAEPFRL